MSSTICYSTLNPRPIKLRQPVSSKVSTLICRDKFKIIDAEKEIVEVSTEVVFEDPKDTDKIAQSFGRSCGLRAMATRVAINEVGTIFDDSGNVVDATKLPTNIMEAKQVIDTGKIAASNFEKLPKEFTKNMSAEDFIAQYNQSDLINFINDLYAKQNKVVETKTEVKTDE